MAWLRHRWPDRTCLTMVTCTSRRLDCNHKEGSLGPSPCHGQPSKAGQRWTGDPRRGWEPNQSNRSGFSLCFAVATVSLGPMHGPVVVPSGN